MAFAASGRFNVRMEIVGVASTSSFKVSSSDFRVRCFNNTCLDDDDDVVVVSFVCLVEVVPVVVVKYRVDFGGGGTCIR